MIKTTLPEKTAVSQVVIGYRRKFGESGKLLSLREFADRLDRFLISFGGGISHQSVKNWQDRKHFPNVFKMTFLSRNSYGWEQDFALDIMSVLKPLVYKPVSLIGRRAIEEMNNG